MKREVWGSLVDLLLDVQFTAMLRISRSGSGTQLAKPYSPRDQLGVCLLYCACRNSGFALCTWKRRCNANATIILILQEESNEYCKRTAVPFTTENSDRAIKLSGNAIRARHGDRMRDPFSSSHSQTSKGKYVERCNAAECRPLCCIPLSTNNTYFTYAGVAGGCRKSGRKQEATTQSVNWAFLRQSTP